MSAVRRMFQPIKVLFVPQNHRASAGLEERQKARRAGHASWISERSFLVRARHEIQAGAIFSRVLRWICRESSKTGAQLNAAQATETRILHLSSSSKVYTRKRAAQKTISPSPAVTTTNFLRTMPWDYFEGAEGFLGVWMWTTARGCLMVWASHSSSRAADALKVSCGEGDHD